MDLELRERFNKAWTPEFYARVRSDLDQIQGGEQGLLRGRVEDSGQLFGRRFDGGKLLVEPLDCGQ